MTASHDQLQAFVDGELAPAEAEAFRAHLAGCERCEAGLLQAMQLAALGEELRAQGGARHPEGAPVASLAAHAARRRRSAMVFVAPALAAAAAVALWLGAHRGDVAKPAASALASLSLAERRSFEPRLSAPAADRYREYSVARSAGPAPREDIPLRTLAALEDARDQRTLAAAYLLMRDERQAEAALAHAGESPDTQSDRAALALAQQHAEVALALADAALAVAPQHAQAQWNRALALRELGLPLTAADAFDAVAARGEPGWSDEAKARSAKLRAEGQSVAKSWEALRAAGLELIAHGTPLDETLVAAHPSAARLYFYHALRAAPSRERALALAPLAAALDRADGHGDVLAAEVARVAAADFATRAPLAATYAGLATGQGRLDDAAAQAYLATIRKAPARAGARDLELGALLMTTRAVAEPAALEKVAAASGDPWFASVPASKAAAARRDAHDLLGAERILVAALAACKVDYRCLQLESDLAVTVMVGYHRPLAARPHLQTALATARRIGAYDVELIAGYELGQAALELGEFALARAYMTEALHRAELLGDPASRCITSRNTLVELVTLDIAALDYRRALEDQRRTPGCDAVPELQDLLVAADLSRYGETAAEIEATRAQLAQARAGQRSPDWLAAADVVEGRLAAASDAHSATPILRRAIAAVDALATPTTLGKKARAYAYETLIGLAGTAGDHAGALALFAEEQHLALPARCVLGMSYDDDRVEVAARGADGAAVGALARRKSPTADPASFVPAPVIKALTPCDEVAVLARGFIHGRPVLPAAIAWRFVTAGAAETAAAPGSARRLVVASPEPPAELGLPALAGPAPEATSGAIALVGPAATPARVLAELAQATDVEIHAHGLRAGGEADTSFLALTPGPDGKFALSALDLLGVRMSGRPLVVLAACETSEAAPYQHETWDLPAAFLAAGARAVLASDAEMPDADAARFFAGVRARLARGESIARATRDERVEWSHRPGSTWVEHVIVFETFVPGAGQ